MKKVLDRIEKLLLSIRHENCVQENFFHFGTRPRDRLSSGERAWLCLCSWRRPLAVSTRFSTPVSSGVLSIDAELILFVRRTPLLCPTALNTVHFSTSTWTSRYIERELISFLLREVDRPGCSASINGDADKGEILFVKTRLENAARPLGETTS